MANKSDDITHYQGRYLSMVERKGWEFVTRSNATGVVILIALTEQKELVFVEQFRPPVGKQVIELPAGLIGDKEDADESVLSAAARELEEETGYQAGRLKPVLSCPGSAGMSDEYLHFVAATQLSKVGPGGGDDTEDIVVHVIPLANADQWLGEQLKLGKTLDPKIYTGIHWACRNT